MNDTITLMKWANSRLSAWGVGVLAASLFTTLLVRKDIGELTYTGVISVTALVALTIYLSPRLIELDLKSFKMTLEKLEKVKAEIEEMYGGIENIKRGKLVLDDTKMEELGTSGGHFAVASAVFRFPVGCIKRERERLASIFITGRPPEQIAEAIVDGSKDDLVFKWEGPEVALDVAPRSVEQRKTAKAEAEAKKTGAGGTS